MRHDAADQEHEVLEFVTASWCWPLQFVAEHEPAETPPPSVAPAAVPAAVHPNAGRPTTVSCSAEAGASRAATAHPAAFPAACPTATVHSAVPHPVAMAAPAAPQPGQCHSQVVISIAFDALSLEDLATPLASPVAV
eukprot:scaffold16.g81.t1